MVDIRAAVALEPPPLSTIRRVLAWTLVYGAAGLLTELILVGHYETPAQYVPLLLLGIVVMIGVVIIVAPTAGKLRILQMVLVVVVTSGILGIGLHLQHNETEERARDPLSSRLALLLRSLSGTSPVLAPGAMALLGVVGLAFTHRHPLFRAARDTS